MAYREIEPWVVGTSASFHSTLRRDILQNYVMEDYGHVYIVDGGYLDIIRKGNVNLVILNDIIWTLKGVRHMSRLKETSSPWFNHIVKVTSLAWEKGCGRS